MTTDIGSGPRFWTDAKVEIVLKFLDERKDFMLEEIMTTTTSDWHTVHTIDKGCDLFDWPG